MRRKMKSSDPFPDKIYNTPIEGQEDLCKLFRGAFEKVLECNLDKEEIEVEFFKDGETLTAKVRRKNNEWMEEISMIDWIYLLRNIRTYLNRWKPLRCAKVQSSFHPNKEKTNIRIVYNPHWRRYENYEIFFRSKTQSNRRKHQ